MRAKKGRKGRAVPGEVEDLCDERNHSNQGMLAVGGLAGLNAQAEECGRKTTPPVQAGRKRFVLRA